MTDRRRQLLAVLADGEFHSGQRLADIAGVTRAAVWKQVGQLDALGLEIERVRGRGYRLAAPLQLLQEDAINARLDAAARGIPVRVQVLFETGSTNQYLLDDATAEALHGRALLAEYQSAGRGRGMNRWLSAPASGLCLSLGWHYESIPDSLTALSLATGVVLTRVLQQAGCAQARLKWPNDVVVEGAKLAGILIESRAQGAGPCDVVIGIGINVRLQAALERSLDRNVTDLQRLLPARVPARNDLAAALINALVGMLHGYQRDGFAAYREQWQALDYSAGKQAELLQQGRCSRGRVLGIDDNGLLLMQVDGATRRYSSGELSLRVLE